MRRKTTQRTTIKEIFLQKDRPLTVAELLSYGREVVATLNQATVYRNLKILLNDGWLRRISHPSLGTLYERTGKGHHHHFYCRECNRAFELPGCVMKEEDATPAGFVVEDHEIFLFGICPSCAR